MRLGSPNLYDVVSPTSYGWTIASFVLAIVGGILVLALFLNKSNKNKYTGNLKRLYEFLNFDYLTLDIVIKFLYTAITIFVILNSFTYISVDFLQFILYLVTGLVFTRVTFEILMLTIKLCKNTTEINAKLTKKEDKKNK